MFSCLILASQPQHSFNENALSKWTCKLNQVSERSQAKGIAPQHKMHRIIPVKSLPSSSPSASPLPPPLSSAHPVLSQQQSPQHFPAFLPEGFCMQCSFDYYVCDLSCPRAIHVLWLKGRLKREFLPDICDLSCGLSFQALKSKASFANELVLGWKNKPSLFLPAPFLSLHQQQLELCRVGRC